MTTGRELRPTTRAHYRVLLDTYINPTFGDERLDRITAEDANDWYNALARARRPRAGPEPAAHCLELLLMELDRQGVHQVWVESRKSSQDARDVKMLDAVRSKGLVSASLRLDFALPKAEPMLWIPDAVAGAVGAARKDEDALPRDLLGASVTELSRRLT